MIKRLSIWPGRSVDRITGAILLIVGGIGGVIFWGSFNTFMEYTNTLPFCTSCHEMRAFLFEEYKQTVHYKNRTGVRVVCADCHVPKDWTAKLVRKIHASNELFHKFLGSIETREKFEAKRLELAERVWATMKKNDSRECRNCHAYEAMDFHKQSRRGSTKMREAMEKKETCIECHKGVAHKLPADYEKD